MKKMNQLIVALGFVALSLSANAKDRYLVIFKSEQGFKAMENFMSQEAGRGYGMQKSLKNIQGVVLKTKNAKAIEQLALHPEVAVVEREIFTPSPKPVNGYISQNDRVNRDAEEFDAVVTPANLNFKQGEQTPWGIIAVNAPQAWGESDGGANARVLVLDTGIDKEHPDLKSNFEEGRNFFENTSGPNPDDFSDSVGHGTHCSGTIAAAYNPETGFAGVAPKAKLLMGRVCGDLGCSNIAVAQGINWGVEKKVDVISMSLGGPMASSGERMAVQNAERAGVVIVAASGNDGTQKVSYPAAFPTVVAVGALDSTLKKTDFSQWGPELDITAPGAAVLSSVPRGMGRDSVTDITVDGVTTRIKSVTFGGTKEIVTPRTGELVFVNLGKTDDFAKANVRGKFALISRGEISFADKVNNAIKAGATGAVIFNNVPGFIHGTIGEDEKDIALVMIEQTVGQQLVKAISEGKKAASTIATVRTNYAEYDGTSMATPHVAGVVALIKSANKKLTPAQVRTILTSTATPLGPNDTNQYGAGLVQADKAVRAAAGM